MANRLHMLGRRAVVVGAAAAAMLSLSMGTGFAQDSWKPEKGVELVVGTAPGGSMDRLARFAEEWLKGSGDIAGDSVVLHKPGGGHAIALSYVKELAGDAHHLMAVNTLLITNNLLGRSDIRFSEFTPIAVLYEEPMTFAVRADSEIVDGADLVRRLKEDPASVSFSVSSGVGTANHVSAVLLAQAIGIDPKAIKAVSFESGAEGITATLGGHIDVVITPPESLIQFVEDGQLRFLAVAGDTRGTGKIADVPTWKELGVDASVSAWRGVIGPPGLSAAQVAFWEDAFKRMIESDVFKTTAEAEFFTAKYMNGADTGAFLAALDAQYKAYLDAIGFTPTAQ